MKETYMKPSKITEKSIVHEPFRSWVRFAEKNQDVSCDPYDYEVNKLMYKAGFHKGVEFATNSIMYAVGNAIKPVIHSHKS